MTTDPIILVGMQRSGTTWMGRVFGQHPGIAYWPEPRQVWSFGNWFRPDDRLTEEHASPWVRRHIRRTFADFARDHGGRFCEKTPSNCLRLPFIRAVFPEARILLIVRDGRSIIRSTAEQRMERRAPWERMRARAKELRVWDIPSFASRIPSIVGPLFGRPYRYWGVRPPGWKKWMREDPPFVIFAKQWAATIRTAVTDGRALDPERFLEIRYEALTERPQAVMQQVVDFFQIARGAELVNKVVSLADPSRQAKWKDELDADTIDQIRPHIEPTLEWLGYEW